MRKSEWTKRPRTRPEPNRLIRCEGEDFEGKFSLLAEMRPRPSGVGASLWVQHRRHSDFTFAPDYWPKTTRWKYAQAPVVAQPEPALAETAEA